MSVNYKIIDNLILPDQHSEIADCLLGLDFPWFYNSSVVEENDDTLHNYQLVHGFYNNNLPNSQWFSLLLPIIEAINPLSIVRIKANLNPWTETQLEYPYHIDIQSPLVTTAVYYINTNNGVTKFKDGSEISSVANRLVEFNALTPHTGTTCTDSKIRCLINFNYIKREQ